MVLYTEILELFCTSFRLALVSKILLKTLSECESRIVGRSPNSALFPQGHGFVESAAADHVVRSRKPYSSRQKQQQSTALRLLPNTSHPLQSEEELDMSALFRSRTDPPTRLHIQR